LAPKSISTPELEQGPALADRPYIETDAAGERVDSTPERAVHGRDEQQHDQQEWRDAGRAPTELAKIPREPRVEDAPSVEPGDRYQIEDQRGELMYWQ
jgi:hypothetical protein